MIKYFFQDIIDEFSGFWFDLKTIFNRKYYNSEQYKLDTMNKLNSLQNLPKLTMEEFREWKNTPNKEPK